jgi:hypothetical protein
LSNGVSMGCGCCARCGGADAGAELVQEAKDIVGRDVLTANAPVVPLGWLVFVELPILADHVNCVVQPIWFSISLMN